MLVLSKLPELKMNVACHKKNIIVIIYRSETVVCFYLLKNLGKTAFQGKILFIFSPSGYFSVEVRIQCKFNNFSKHKIITLKIKFSAASLVARW